MHLFAPGTATMTRPANPSGAGGCILFFFGGGWRLGTPEQFYPHCSDLAAARRFAASDFPLWTGLIPVDVENGAPIHLEAQTDRIVDVVLRIRPVPAQDVSGVITGNHP